LDRPRTSNAERPGKKADDRVKMGKVPAGI
jgi:hypothetical protein